mmetsp:Transcript_57428/g.157727  ORF Transcript_57428/g.157727 Transcript_57428/m.157727 type:complete len:99 (-) Transcript_57428:58-354(-)|eukprot:2561124-Prymnesium_polylepis.1
MGWHLRGRCVLVYHCFGRCHEWVPINESQSTKPDRGNGGSVHVRRGVTVARRGMLVAMQQSDLYLSVMHAQKMYAAQCCVVLLLACYCASCGLQVSSL